MTAPDAIWRQYLNRRMLICVFLGFTSGLPLFILLSLLQAWLAKSGLNVKTLGLFALVMFPYTWKFVWSPLMDRFHFGKMGRRRGWMFFTQLLLFLGIGCMGMLDPLTQVPTIAFMASVVAFLSASQDIAIDAFRREILPDDELGLGSAIHVNAYKLSGMVPGALSLVLADRMPWASVFWITAAFMLPGLLCSLLVKEPKMYGVPPKSLYEAVVLPFREFIARGGWRSAAWVLGFIFFYKLGDSMATALATKFYIDLGFSMTEIGVVSKTTSLWASVAGGIIGGVWMVKLGINRALWVFGVLQAIPILGFAWLAHVGASLPTLAAVIGLEAFGVGLGTTAFVAYIMRETDPRYTATQFALFTSLMAVPRTFVNSSVGYVVAETGWLTFFVICFVLALPGMLMLPRIAPWNEKPVESQTRKA
ncbi:MULTISPECIES: AmpG family muropeptide MFS transporter [unclassified Herbaspirillum]|uniref:AmpG family muropeptide MFS transporter n=1 Tax=unclassified Herbaspirillum TaxID=2624150 RepID=UPI00114E474F|nr:MULTISPECIES: AmpG family muropeptide MFS transporter [unclassified Herbaspirillum]MBB5393746.1 PAT family beta-lactamase induction signal transducer AmpG [Herbaspirillum sp. SJZ102]TQK01392.1 PAT family beta-lactamase induction signal transducer AmpG [Herbaspirillum sp. SJZ130]TQK05788.1 PAT family beta-lactamase induction signal transducer AmpG [Herbaspirillum sp. SJZ106]